MNTKPILFSGDMIRAILDGRKTQTRRIMKPQIAGPWQVEDPPVFGRITSPHPLKGRFGVFIRANRDTKFPRADLIPCPYGQPGDLLWVRENWRPYAWHEGDPVDIEFTDGTVRACECRLEDEARNIDWEVSIWESASAECQKAGLELNDEGVYSWEPGESPLKWRPSIHLPRWASRITLKITDVRVQRIQEITRQDAAAEGVCLDLDKPLPKWCQSNRFPEENFRALWDSINEQRETGKYRWAANPWVWALTFEVIRENVDAVLQRAA